jgi:hypothetical protein
MLEEREPQGVGVEQGTDNGLDFDGDTTLIIG